MKIKNGEAEMKILNLYSGIGGNRKNWGDDHEITAIEYDQATADVYQSYFPNDTVIVTDAHEYLLNHFKEYDFIWSSPPCPTHSDIRRMAVDAGSYAAVYPDMALYQEIILLKNFAQSKTKFCIENVSPYYDPLINPDCIIDRHFYWCNFNIPVIDVEKKKNLKYFKSDECLYGFDVRGTKIKDKRKAMRNMVDPDIGLHILNCALGHQMPVNFGLFAEV